jgi:hypothetical protein
MGSDSAGRCRLRVSIPVRFEMLENRCHISTLSKAPVSKHTTRLALSRIPNVQVGHVDITVQYAKLIKYDSMRFKK